MAVAALPLTLPLVVVVPKGEEAPNGSVRSGVVVAVADEEMAAAMDAVVDALEEEETVPLEVGGPEMNTKTTTRGKIPKVLCQ